MTERTGFKVVCDCGHEGTIVCAENDSPFSRSYEEYTLNGLNGGTKHYTPFAKTWEIVIQDLEPTCPKCGAKIKVSNIIFPT